MRRASIFLALAAAGVTLAPAAAGAVSRPEFHGLGRCAPDVTHIEQTPGGEAYFAFSVPADCDPQTWTLYFEDLAANGGRDLPAEGRRLIATASVTLPRPDLDTGDTIHSWEGYLYYIGQPPCGAQLDLVLAGDDQPYAANVIERDDCTPPTLTAAQPRETPPAEAPLPPPAPPQAAPTPASEVPPPTAGPAAGGPESDDTPPVSTSGSAAAIDVAVEASSIRAQLPDTGARQVGVLAAVGGALIALGALLFGTGRAVRRDGKR